MIYGESLSSGLRSGRKNRLITRGPGEAGQGGGGGEKKRARGKAGGGGGGRARSSQYRSSFVITFAVPASAKANVEID